MKTGTGKRKLLCMLLCVSIFFSLAPGLYAAGGAKVSPYTGNMQLLAWSAGGADVTIDLSATTPAGAGYTYDTGTKVVTISDSGNTYNITGTTTTKSVVVTGAGVFNITLSDVSIGNTGKVPLDCAGATVELTLSGSNSLTNGTCGAAIHSPAGASLTIGGTGRLTAIGGTSGAGIGGSENEAGGNIAITGGTITAKGGSSGAGIGGGLCGTGGAVVISGGSVNAIAGSNALPIGMGEDSIPGGTVKNASGTDVYLSTVTLKNAGSGISVSSLSIKASGSAYAYSIIGMATDSEGNLYLYLPGGAHTTASAANGTGYTGDVATTTDNAAKGELNASSYTVAFDSRGGTAVPSITAQSGARISVPASPTRSNYSFAGWYKETACTNAWDFSTDTVKGSTTLYAKWAQESVVVQPGNDGGTVVAPPVIPLVVVIYKASFETRGGSAVPPQWGGSGERISAPADPTRLDMAFGGWYKDPGCSQPWNFGSDKLPDHNITLYAKWVYKMNAYAENPNYGSVQGSGTYEPMTGCSVVASPKDGYAFSHWLENGKIISTEKIYITIINSSRTLVAVFKQLPPAPTVKAFPASCSKADISWTAVQGAAYYEIHRAEVTKTLSEYSLHEVTKALRLTDTDLLFKRTYYYRVRAVFTDRYGNVIGYGPYGAASTAPRIVVPSVTAKCDNALIQVNWTTVEGAGYYRLFRQIPTEKNMVEILRTTDAATTSFIDKNGKMGESYVYVLRAYGTLISYEGASRPKAIESYGEAGSNWVKQIPGRPVLSTERSKNRKKIELSWTKAVDASRYEVYSAVKDGNFNMIKERYSIYHNWTNSGLDTGLSYWYKVRAYAFDKNGNKVYGEFSNLVEVP